jgi:hypothetical protein
VCSSDLPITLPQTYTNPQFALLTITLPQTYTNPQFALLASDRMPTMSTNISMIPHQLSPSHPAREDRAPLFPSANGAAGAGGPNERFQG